MSCPPTRHYRFEAFALDTQTRELREGDGPVIPLTAKAFDTLCLLIENRHRLVTKDDLLASVWAGRVVEENNLTQAISALRRAFGTTAGDHRYIVTVPGRGYRFVAELRADEATAPELDPTAGPPTLAWRWAMVPGAVLVLLSVAAWQWHQAPVAQASPQATLAVLPFTSLSPGSRDQMLELGLAETLIARISTSTTLRVRSLASSQRFAGSKQDPLDAGRQLGAAYVVEGTTQRSGGRIRVSARLLDVRDGSSVWSGTFDEGTDRVFTLQDRIAAGMTSALALKVSTVPGRSPCDGANAEAYRAYLIGRYQLDRPSGARMRQALVAFRRAIDLDPSCARAYAGTAYAYRALVMTGDQDPRQNFPMAKAAVKQALAINPGLAEAYSSQGFIQFWYDWDWKASETSFKRAIELNPSLGEAHLGYAHLLSNLGRNDEAAVHARQAVALDPLSPLVNTLASAFIAGTGAVEEAGQTLSKALELEPDFWIALLVRNQKLAKERDYAGAIADLSRARERCGDCSQVLAVLGRTYAQAGDRGGAEQVLRDMENRDSAGYMPATSLAAVHNALGHTDAALALLERAYEERDVRMTFLMVDTHWNNLRGQPRFRALAQRMNMAESLTAAADHPRGRTVAP